MGVQQAGEENAEGLCVGAKAGASSPEAALLLLPSRCWLGKVKPYASLKFLRLEKALCQA